MSFFVCFFAFISGIRSSLIILLLLYSPPTTTLEFPKYRSVVSISCQNAISEFSLWLLFSPLYSLESSLAYLLWGREMQQKGGRAGEAVGSSALKCSLASKREFIQKRKWYSCLKNCLKISGTMKPRDLSIFHARLLLKDAAYHFTFPCHFPACSLHPTQNFHFCQHST